MLAKNKKVWIIKIVAILCILSTVGIFDYWMWGPKQNTPVATNTATKNNDQNPINNNLTNDLAPDQEKKPIVALDQAQKTETPETVPNQAYLDVPFVSQAPLGVWDESHNEACEETALIIAKAWTNNQKITKQEAEKEILAAIDWQNKNFGGHYDLPAEKIVELGKQFFGLTKINLYYRPTLDDIKKEIASGNLVIVPTAGRLLNNSYYRQPGPVYHMLVIRGYDDQWIITNDPGTKHGENFKYAPDNLFGAMHDWPFKAPDYGQNISKDEKAVEIIRGEKTMIVVEK